MEIYKKKISNLLKIDLNRIILRNVKYGTTNPTLVIVDQTRQEDDIIRTIDELDNVVEINKKVLVDNLILSKDILEPRWDRHKGWGIDEKRGGENYIPPLDGWVALGLKVLNKYENNNNWLSYEGIKGEYAIAYYGLYNNLGNNEELISDLNEDIRDIKNIISERLFQDEKDKRTGFWIFREKCGGGVCLFQDPKFAEKSAGIVSVHGVNYKILLMCRVNPKKIRQPLEYDKFWILNPTPDEIRPYRILIKKYFNSRLSNTEIKINRTPIDYIINAIRSNDFRFYEFKNRRFECFNTHNNNNNYFMFTLYSSCYYKPINRYMYNGDVLEIFNDEYNGRRLGFNRTQLNSCVCCLQHALFNTINVPNDTIVYRGINLKFSNDINIDSQFYFSNFVSTSRNRKTALGFKRGDGNKGTLMTITIKNNGTDEHHPNYCTEITDYSLSPEQKEIVICSHCLFQVTSISRTDTIDYVDLICRGYSFE